VAKEIQWEILLTTVEKNIINIAHPDDRETLDKHLLKDLKCSDIDVLIFTKLS
jgi:hypothetical protein